MLTAKSISRSCRKCSQRSAMKCTLGALARLSHLLWVHRERSVWVGFTAKSYTHMNIKLCDVHRRQIPPATKSFSPLIP